MSTLADELLNDFEDSGSEGEADRQNGFLQDAPSSPASSVTVGRGQSTYANGAAGVMVRDVDEEDDDEDEEMTNGDTLASGALEDAEDEEEAKAKVEKMQLGGINDVRNVAGLMKTLEPVLQVGVLFLFLYQLYVKLKVYISCEHSPDVLRRIQKIAQYQALPPDKQTTFVGSIEDNPEYHLLTQSNTLSTSIDNEIILVHKFIRDHYSTRFPELETLVTNPLDYAKSVAIIGNGPMDNIKELAQRTDNIVGAPLKSILDGPSLMVVTVESTTTRGREMSPTELQTVLRACEMTLSLDRAKKILTEYVQSRMNLFAPNLTALIGSLTAAQLLNFAGGLTGLAKTPACNIPPLGSKKQSQTGFATNVGVRHQGFLYHSPIIRGIPSDLKRQAMRIVAAKCVLAARVDRVHASPDGSNGLLLKNDTLARLEKLTEPPPNKGPRALPAPDDKPSRKRGGRRARKAKEATAMTDLRKAQNRMAFGKEEREVGYGTGEGTKGLGMIGQANEGRIRSQQIDQRTKAKLSKSNKGWGGATPLGTSSSLRGFGQNVGAGGSSTLLRGGQHGLRTMGVGGTGTSGTASSLAFTPVQGLELVDPKAQAEMRRKREEEADRWFKGGTFTQVGTGGGGMGGSGAGGESGGGGFKVPGLPARKMAPPPPPSPLSALGTSKK
ncbi:U4/U6-U5 snRNP complex subunit prp31 [Lobaria immixta]|nr:U4/U6-U5 snRNP complex subunit prp31 [Lobaria immixta]